MKTLKTSRAFTTVIARLSLYAYLTYVAFLIMFRSAALTLPSAEDIMYVVMWGSVVAILNALSMSLRMLYVIIKKPIRRHS